jgi:hypothetical protein
MTSHDIIVQKFDELIRILKSTYEQPKQEVWVDVTHECEWNGEYLVHGSVVVMSANGYRLHKKYFETGQGFVVEVRK